MTYLALLFLCAILPVGSATASSRQPIASLAASSPDEIVISFSAPPADLQISASGDSHYSVVSLDGEGRTLSEGFPDLPVVHRVVLVPDGMDAEVEVIADQTSTVKLNAPVRSFEDNPDPTTASAFTSGVFPVDPVAVGEIQNFRGMRVLPVIFHPYQYDKDSERLIVHDECQIAVRFIPSGGPDAAATLNSRPKTLTRDVYRFLDAVAVNSPQRDDGGAGLPRGGYLIVVGTNITRNQAEAAVEEFADWKRACGHYVEVVWGQNNPQTITNDFILPAYREWDPPLEHLCLLGPWGDPASPPGGRSDVYFGLLEGGNNDHYPEISVSRLSASSATQAQVVIGRALAYQQLPNRGRNDLVWTGRAGSCAEGVRNWTIGTSNGARWVAEAMRRAGFDGVVELYANAAGQYYGGQIGNWIGQRINTVFIRGFGRVVQPGSFQANNFPMYLSVGGGHGEGLWTQLWNLGSPNELRGPSAGSSTSHNQVTLTCDVLGGGMARGVIVQHLPIGWARAYAMLMLDYGGAGSYAAYANEWQMFGDPSQTAWLGRPSAVSVICRDEIPSGSNRLEVWVQDEDEEVGIENAFITLTQPGILLTTGVTDQDGRCVLSIDPDLEDEVILTVTGDRIIPEWQTIDIEENSSYLSAYVSDINDDDGGNGDGRLNPGESVELTLTAVNHSEDDVARDVTGEIISTSSWVTIQDPQLNFGDIDADDEAVAEDPIVVSLASTAPDAVDLEIVIELTVGEDAHRSFLPLGVRGPNLEIESIEGGGVVDQEIGSLMIRLRNVGRVSSPAMSVELVAESWEIQVLEGESEIGALNPNRVERLSGDPFLINPSIIAVPGTKVPMTLLLRVDEDDEPYTIPFELQIDEPRENAPQGPDDYGYICFDDTDEGWEIAPEYQWIEINPRDNDPDFEGDAVPGQRPADFGVEIDLPFTFVFYGEEFNTAMISENGYIALGEGMGELSQPQNYPLDQNMSGAFAMIAPYWDDLNMTLIGRNIYTYFDDEEMRFIVQWIGHVRSGDNAVQFQVILYDPEFYPFFSGDGMIKFQYKQVPDPVRGDGTSPAYFSTGISSPDGISGINYVADNQYPVTSAPIVDRRALIFVTAAYSSSGTLYGLVTDHATGEPIERALVWTNFGQAAFTDEGGAWMIEKAWATEFSITADMHGYNDSTRADLALGDDEELEVNFDLLHPEFELSNENISSVIGAGETEDHEYTLTNHGNGPLYWRLERHLLGDADNAPWEFRQAYQVGQEVNDSRIRGVEYAGDRFYVAGRDMIYVIDNDGNEIDRYQMMVDDQPLDFEDLAWDGELLWGSDGAGIYGFTPEGELMVDFDSPFNPTTRLAWDEENGHLWVSSTTTNIQAIDREGNRGRILDRLGLRIYGLAYWSEDPDGYYLYILHSPRDGMQVVTKMKPANGDTMFVQYLEPEGGGSPQGLCITNLWDVYSWVFMNVSNYAADDRIDIWHLEGRRDWMQVDPILGTLNTGEVQEFMLTLDATGLPRVIFPGELVYYHNAEQAESRISITLEVTGNPGEEDVRTLNFHRGWNMVSLNVEPDEPNVRALTAPLVEAGVLLILKDGEGRFYSPPQDFNNIPEWDAASAYKAYLTENASIEVEGVIIAPDHPIPLDAGWNMVSYYPRTPSSPQAATRNIVDRLTILKDNYGHFYMPRYGYANFDRLLEGQGYEMKVTEAVELVYGQDDQLAALDVGAAPKLAHYAEPSPTPANMSLLIISSGRMEGEIAAYSSDGRLCGAGVVRNVVGDAASISPASASASACGLAVWGDDPLTESVEGLDDGESFQLRRWDEAGQKEVEIMPIRFHIGNGLTYRTDDIVVVEVAGDAALPGSYFLAQNYPNPFNAATRLTYGVPEAGRVSLKIYDLSGRLVATLVDGYVEAGYRSAVWDGRGAPSGVYIARMTAGEKVFSRKLALVR